MTLSAFAWNIARTYTLTPGRRSFGCRGTASNLRQRSQQRLRAGTFLGTPSQGVWSTARLDFLVPPGGVAKLHLRRLDPRAGADLYSMQIRASAFEARVGLRDGPGRLAGPDVNCKDVFTTGVDASVFLRNAHSHRRRSHAVVHRRRVRQLAEHHRGGQRGTAELGHRNHMTINNTANAGNFTTAGDVSTGTLTASGAATFAATGALTGVRLTITGAATGPLDCKSLGGGVSTGSVVRGDVTSSGTAPQLFASNTLTVTNTSDFSDDLFLTKNWAGWSKLQVQQRSAHQFGLWKAIGL